MNCNINFCITPVHRAMHNLSKKFVTAGKFPLLLMSMILIGCLLNQISMAQDPTQRFRNFGGGGKGSDTALKHRTEDTIVINFRFLDSSRLRKFDSSVYDFSKKIPLPNTYFDLGNFGTAARNLVFAPNMKPGWDPGLHAYDTYLFTIDETKFYNTTRPYTELGYLIGSKAEQMISLVHTQNITKDLNAAFQYRLINAPGAFQNQNTNHNNYRFTTWYQSKNKRYQAFLILMGSKLQSSENGGIRDPKQLDSIGYSDRFAIPTRLGLIKNAQFVANPFSTNITTGSFYSVGNFLLRQQYDIIGKKDSIVTDTTVIPLFYPRVRAEYTINYNTYHYRFVDQDPDSVFYISYYNFFSTPDTIRLSDQWHQLINDFSLYQFPDAKNPQQFIKAGASIENLKGFFDAGSKTLYNAFIHGEYRNKTRNQKWDVEAYGKLYLTGANSGDYDAYISLKRQISKNLGSLQVGFHNVNRTPSFVFDRESSFGFGNPNTFFSKENNTNLFGSLELPKLRMVLSGNYYLINNYTYFQRHYNQAQETNPFNVLQISLDKVFVVDRHWVWRLLLVAQQKAGASPINIPAIVTFNQLGYEGNLGFKNLLIAFGLEARYFTAYKADGYSPPVGQFFIQNDTTIRQNLPDINAYIQFRIRSFTAYVRGENLNTFAIGHPVGTGFYNNNFVAPYYPYPGFRFRIGIFWTFVN
ncbi:MAG: hypothetical protein C5B59_15815 [Bacteroidetes bacterium]|nr:MAG: hypothetical protein C5B59_15815 [Bacteroidota bacterium]